MLVAVVFVGLTACDALPGKPRPEDRPVVPAKVTDFDTLYAGNCAGCHGANGQLGAARPLNDPLYLVLVGPGVITPIIANGIPSTAQPAFAQRAGGMLTDEQVGILARGLAPRWGQPDRFRGVSLPPYSNADAQQAGSGSGDPQRGAAAYGKYCAQCHGETGSGGPKAGSIVDPSYLALVSDQALRTAVIAGRNDLGMPDWRNYLPGQPMSPQEISDVVAWLSSRRVPFPGQPYANKGVK